ncbi:hypothetical protein PVAND_008266 [Polypedilum vanderplanki]|uniref:Serum response factor homolog n=1 Tax=Polypedilum vanderplanki TaxID=319348 RepID=A0A9J6C9L2_POLVA|nr:hypothetical protein PVAND_008266 [Polypedilum vanderplanki]
MEPPRENSPSTPSRYLNSYLQQNPTELFHQNFPQRQLSNQQFYAAAAAADNLSTNNKSYLKRHHQNYEKNDGERDKKYEKYDSKKLEEQSIHQTQGHPYDGFHSDAYTTSGGNGAGSITTSTGTGSTTTATQQKPGGNTKSLSNGKKTKGRVKIKMEYIDNKLRRYTTFSKRKTGIMKKAYELSTLTGTQVMLLVASETGHVYTFATRKLQPMITSEAGKTLIQTCLNSPDLSATVSSSDQRMSATGFEETELNYSISDIGDNPGDKEKLSFQDDITSTDDSEESENDENFIVHSQQNNHKSMPQQQQQAPLVVQQPRVFEEENKQSLHQQQNHRINEKILDNQKLLLESLSNLPQNLLQNWIQSGQLQVSVDEDGMQSISIPFAIQKENSTQEIVTKKIPIKLLMGNKIKSEAE